jgi:hypothetical protein
MSPLAPEQSPESFGTLVWRWVRRLVLLIIGVPITLAGLVFLVTPGPGIPVLLAGLAILAIEFTWARNRLHDVRRGALRLVRRGDPTADPSPGKHAR